MNAQAVRPRGPLFWILVVCVGLGACCGLPMVGGLALWAMGDADVSAPSPSPSSSDTNEPDDFIYTAANGLVYVATSTVSAEGVNVTLTGEWRDDHRNIILRLRDGGRYELMESGGVLTGTHTNPVAFGSKTGERGTWTIEGAALTLSPEEAEVSGSVGTRQLERGTEQGDGPREWTVVGLTIDYTREGEATVRQRPGLRVKGPAPSWYYPPGDCDWVLRSAPWSD
jgi:hypothetical protein